jgi:hypothetical protein
MAWQRKIPFGYRIQDGETVLHPDEADAVRGIFDRYLKGGSYRTIANGMSGDGFHYHEATPKWNKHMVTRILENARYTGADGWLTIIPGDVFDQAAELRASKTEGCREQPVCVNAVKRKLICAICGTSYSVSSHTRDGIRWRHCGNEECGAMLKLADAELERRVTALLNRLAEQPSLLDMATSDAPMSPDAERIQNELYRELGKADWDENRAQSLAFAYAAEHYQALGDGDARMARAAALKEKLSGMTTLAAFDGELFHEAVEALLVYADGALALKLVSGVIVKENESGEENTYADANH